MPTKGLNALSPQDVQTWCRILSSTILEQHMPSTLHGVVGCRILSASLLQTSWSTSRERISTTPRLRFIHVEGAGNISQGVKPGRPDLISREDLVLLLLLKDPRSQEPLHGRASA